jgi:predicted phosphodiesterase
VNLRDEALRQSTANKRPPDARRQRPAAPKGWEPGVRFDPAAGTGHIITEPLPAGTDPDWGHIFDHFGLEPERYEVVPPVEMRSWEGWANDGDGTVTRWLYYYKARFQPRSTHVSGVAIDDLLAVVSKDRRVSKLSVGDAALMVCVSDWQTGKRDGDGTLGLIGRVRQAIADLRGRVRDLNRMGVPVGTIYLVGLGDLVEGCDSHYAMQSFGVELNRRDQRKVARRLVAELLRAAAKLAEQVVVVAVGGNHGENRKDGKAYTDFADNDDVAIFEELAEAFAENPDAYGHVSFVLPDDELTVTLDVCGTIVTWAHGHQFGGGATPQQKARSWLADQALGKRAAGDCDLLVSGHYHHLCAAQWGAVGWVQAPALDGGSDWWVNRTGQHSPPGMLSLVVGSTVAAAGWGHAHILGETIATE